MTVAAQPDVAFISWRSQSGRSGGSGLALRCSHAYDESHWQTQTFGEIPDHKVTDVRPFVVLDPEDAEHVDRLGAALLLQGQYVPSEFIVAALREIANPTPPNPAEPTGLGAVVEDSQGTRWVSAATDGHHESGAPCSCQTAFRGEQ